MNKHIIGIGLLGAFLTLICAVSLTLVQSPTSQRNINLDENRIRDFQEIEYMMENHAEKTGSLPPTLEALDVSPRSTEEAQDILTDPQSKKLYDYRVIDAGIYELCTTFATDSAQQAESGITVQVNTRFKHRIGYDCIQLRLSQIITTPTPRKL